MQPLMGSEDFAFYQERIPGYFYFLGMENKTIASLDSAHSPFFQVNEDILPYGAALQASLAATYLFELCQQQVPSQETKYHDEL